MRWSRSALVWPAACDVLVGQGRVEGQDPHAEQREAGGRGQGGDEAGRSLTRSRAERSHPEQHARRHEQHVLDVVHELVPQGEVVHRSGVNDEHQHHRERGGGDRAGPPWSQRARP